MNIIQLSQTVTITFAPQFQNALDILLYSLSVTSKRQYEHTYREWEAFAKSSQFQSSELSPQNIISFIESSDLAHRTKMARLSHLRKLLETLNAEQPDNVQVESWHKQVKLLKVKRNVENQSVEREKHALRRNQIYDVFKCYPKDTKLHIRNRAILAVLFYAGLRRSEAAALEWRDIDLEVGLITVRHGKGDKERTVPILSDTLTEYLAQWDVVTDGRTYVFCGMRKGDRLADDKPIGANAIWELVRDAGTIIGIGNLAPHDARRTLITNALQSGANIADAQFIAGHANPQTTLGYAVVKDAKEVAGRVKLNY